MKNSQERVIGGSPGTFLSGALSRTRSRKNGVEVNLPGRPPGKMVSDADSFCVVPV